MRLFPPTYRGLHDAFPEAPDPTFIEPDSPLFSFVCVGLIAAVPLGLSVLSRNPLPLRSFAYKTAAYGSLGLFATHLISRHVKEEKAKQFLQVHGIQESTFKVVDRLGHLDPDNAYLLGGIGSVLASRRLGGASLGGWRRYAGSFSLGAACGQLVLMAYFNLRFASRPAEREHCVRQVREFCERRWQWQESIVAALRSDAMQHSGAPVLSSAQTLPKTNSVRHVEKPSLHHEPVGSEVTMAEDHSGPHLAVQVPGEQEPVLLTNTNYSWHSDRPIHDLEQHIVKLQEKRRRLADEAEFVWAWLSEREREYHNSKDPSALESRSRLFYLEVLGSWHAKLVGEIGFHDWMLADSRKRIKQIESMHANKDGMMTWQPECSEEAAKTEPSFILSSMRILAAKNDAARAEMDKSYARMTMIMGDPGFVVDDKKLVFNPYKNKTTSERQLIQDFMEQHKKQRELSVMFSEAARSIIADGESRARQGSPTGGNTAQDPNSSETRE